jgi:hypothetical protein
MCVHTAPSPSHADYHEPKTEVKKLYKSQLMIRMGLNSTPHCPQWQEDEIVAYNIQYTSIKVWRIYIGPIYEEKAVPDFGVGGSRLDTVPDHN